MTLVKVPPAQEGAQVQWGHPFLGAGFLPVDWPFSDERALREEARARFLRNPSSTLPSENGRGGPWWGSM